MSRSSLLLHLPLLALVASACRSGSLDSAACGEGQYAAQSVPDTGWRARVEQEIAAAPPDSTLQAAFFFVSAPTDADLADLKARGANIGYLFRGFPAAAGSVDVTDMRSIAIDDTTSRIVNVALAQEVVPLSCR